MYDFKKIEKKWQSKWYNSNEFKAKESRKNKYFLSEMLPYPSGYGLHMGHARNYIIGDVLARYKRMNGFNVLYTMGYDSFGLPAENAAIKEKIHPKKYTEKSINNFIRQQKSLGLSYDWSRTFSTHKKEYYKWDQWIFLQFLKNDLAYKKKALVNYCSKCDTVLANEQVVQGKCWRHSDTDVEIKELEQWFFRTTKYADELLKGLDDLQWPKTIKEMQRNWINESEGTLVNFRLKDTNEILPVFTTRPDTLFGVTFVTFAPEHPKVLELVKGTEYDNDVKNFIKKSIVEKNRESKEGIFIGKYAINPVNNEEVPIYVANFVLMEYGTGMIMSVPAHDQRDYEFAIRYNLAIKEVIKDDKLINSGKFKTKDEIVSYLEKNKIGKKITQYKLRDWLISRQRYWGCPIPVIYCDKCGIVPVPEKDLPVVLPEKVSFRKGNPLESNKKFVNVKCPKCDGKARRETDTMDTFVDSSWYLMRYCDSKNNKKLFDKKNINYWMPVDLYIGGREHATGHLIYFRFFTKAFRDLGLLGFDEPALRLYTHGDVNKDGVRMSKSKGNVVDPMSIINNYGADSLRFYLMFVSSPDSVLEWDDTGINSSYNFINKIYSLKKIKYQSSQKDKIIQSKINTLISNVSFAIENFEYNKALITIMEFTNYFYKNGGLVSRTVFDDTYKKLITLLNPFIPHVTSELKCFREWVKADNKLIDKEIEFTEEFVNNTIDDIHKIKKLTRINPSRIKLLVSEPWKYNLFKNLRKESSRDFDYLIKKYMNKEHSKEIVSLIRSIVKNPKKIPYVLLTQEKEYNILNDYKYLIEKEFNAEIEVMKGSEKAFPGKVAIVLEK
jgi:leucyl-tRNA synthetase